MKASAIIEAVEYNNEEKKKGLEQHIAMYAEEERVI
jgi:hypothetical protein